jgi:hypothetical protein
MSSLGSPYNLLILGPRRIYWSEQSSMRTRLLIMLDWIKRGIFGRDLSKVSRPPTLGLEHALMDLIVLMRWSSVIDL